jgi:hypothetical protein
VGWHAFVASEVALAYYSSREARLVVVATGGGVLTGSVCSTLSGSNEEVQEMGRLQMTVNLVDERD